MGRNLTQKMVITTMTGMALLLTGCPKKADEASAITTKNLYVSSGVCNSGIGMTTYTAATASRVISKWDGNSGKFLETFLDLNIATGFSNTLPQQIIDQGDSVLLLTENATTMTERKIYKIKKNDPNVFITKVPNTSIIAAPVATHISRSMQVDADGMMLMSRSFGIEKFTPIGAFVAGATAILPYANPAAASLPCFNAAASATNFVGDIALMTPFTGRSSGKILFANNGTAITDNRLGAIQSTGLTSGTVADCAGGAQISTTAHTLFGTNISALPAVAFTANGVNPTSMVYIPTPAPATTTGKLLVTYAPALATGLNNTVQLNHAIVMWDVNETSISAITLTLPTVLYRDHSVVFAPSAIAYDSTTSSVYVAVSPVIGSATLTTGNQGYNIEKFTLDLAAPSLTRVSPDFTPFIKGNAQTKCISSMTMGL